MISPATECEGCGHQIGLDANGKVNDHVVCWDGITSKTVTFHKHCNPAEPDLRRHFHVTLEPVILNSSIKGIVG